MSDDDNAGNGGQHAGRRTLNERAEALRAAAKAARAEAKAERERLRERAAELDREATRLEATARARRAKQRRNDERRVGRAVVVTIAELVTNGDATCRGAAQRILQTFAEADRLIAADLLGLAAAPSTAMAGEAGA